MSDAHRALLFLLPLFGASLLSTVSAACDLSPQQSITCKNLKSATAEVKDYCDVTLKGNVFSVGEDGPLARAFPRSKIFDVAYCANAFHDLQQMARRRRVENHMWSTCGAQFIADGANTREEVNEQRQWLVSALNFYNRSGPPVPGAACFTRLLLNESFSQELYRHMEAVHDGIGTVASKLLSEARAALGRGVQSGVQKAMQCWSHAIVSMFDTIDTAAFQCTVRRMVAARNDKRYAVAAVLTNAPFDEWLAQKERHYLVEDWLVSADGTSLDAYPRPAYRRDVSDPIVNGTTTTHHTWGGWPTVSAYFPIPTAGGPAVRYVEHVKSGESDSLLDGIFPSNVAILMLPAFLAAFTPVSLFELSRPIRKVMLYNIMVDLISVVPLGIKGVELLVQASKTAVRCVAYTAGVERNDAESAAIELWCASCPHHNEAVLYGASFLAVSVALLVLGVLIEVVAYKVMIHKMITSDGRRKRWWRPVAFEEHWTTLMCGRPNCCVVRNRLNGNTCCGRLV